MVFLSCSFGSCRIQASHLVNICSSFILFDSLEGTVLVPLTLLLMSFPVYFLWRENQSLTAFAVKGPKLFATRKKKRDVFKKKSLRLRRPETGLLRRWRNGNFMMPGLGKNGSRRGHTLSTWCERQKRMPITPYIIKSARNFGSSNFRKTWRMKRSVSEGPNIWGTSAMR